MFDKSSQQHMLLLTLKLVFVSKINCNENRYMNLYCRMSMSKMIPTVFRYASAQHIIISGYGWLVVGCVIFFFFICIVYMYDARLCTLCTVFSVHGTCEHSLHTSSGRIMAIWMTHTHSHIISSMRNKRRSTCSLWA